jgi:hypothetical protein
MFFFLKTRRLRWSVTGDFQTAGPWWCCHRHSQRVSGCSTARVNDCAYSVPSRFIGSLVQAYVSEETVRFVYRGEEAACCPRSTGRRPLQTSATVPDIERRKPLIKEAMRLS